VIVAAGGERVAERAARDVIGHPLRPLREDLIRVPRRDGGEHEHAIDERVGDLLVEQVAHRIDKDHPRPLPAERLGEFGVDRVDAAGPLAVLVDDAFVAFTAHRLEAEGHAHRVAVVAAGRHDAATDGGVPRRVGPFDFAFVAHDDSLAES
jgi:hypothetical protein